jgi:propanol-preferring alcohol dehydrogenase
LHVVDGELTQPKLPLVPGHEIVGTVVEKGKQAAFLPGGIAWVSRG